MTSSGSQSFVDRAEVSNQYARGRETGLALWGTTSNNKIEWRAGHLERQQHDPDHQRQRRVPVQRPRDVPAERPPGSGPAGLGFRALLLRGRFRIRRLSALRHRRELREERLPPRHHRQRSEGHGLTGFDLVYKYKRFFATGEYYMRERTPETGAEVQLRWILRAGHLPADLAADVGDRRRDTASSIPTDLPARILRTEIRGVVSYYYGRHNLKVQADFGQLKDEAGQWRQRYSEQRVPAPVPDRFLAT